MVYVAKSKIHGQGLFSNTHISKGDEILYVGDERNYDKKYPNYWIEIIARNVNHQKNANCFLKMKGTAFYLYAMRDINHHEELTCDYTMIPSPPFKNDTEGFV